MCLQHFTEILLIGKYVIIPAQNQPSTEWRIDCPLLWKSEFNLMISWDLQISLHSFSFDLTALGKILWTSPLRHTANMLCVCVYLFWPLLFSGLYLVLGLECPTVVTALLILSWDFSWAKISEFASYPNSLWLALKLFVSCRSQESEDFTNLQVYCVEWITWRCNLCQQLQWKGTIAIPRIE
jgi:hypothetical protein